MRNEGHDIFHAIGKFEAKISALENSLEKLEASVSKLTEAMGESKNGWKLLMGLASVAAIIGATAHKPIELILGIFK